MKIYCVNCKKKIDAVLTNGKEIYPHRPDLYNKNFYKCPICKNYVGCHACSTKPLGCIPSNELKQARMRIHALLDPIWKSKKLDRQSVYRQISNKLGYTYHTGNIKSIEECNKILQIVKEIKEKL